ncbi:hypothetical protein L7F22_048410 [Adiantum nelumboides]|nr:hypothetical protein [Adiantum nelumboides]
MAPRQLALFLLAAIFSRAAPPCSAATANITWEAERLLAFKEALTQTDRLTGWNASNLEAACHTWHGVICSDSASTITGLNFTDFNVSGLLTSPVCDLPNLAELRLRNNWFNQSFPDFLLQSCSQLTALDLSMNWFYGLLPINISTSALSKLQEFNMEGNSFEGTIPSDLGNLLQLRLLRLRGNSLSGRIPPSLGRLSLLTILDLTSNSFIAQEIPQELANLSSLQEWDMAWCGSFVEIPAWLGNLSQLRFINLVANNLAGPIPPSLANLPNLTEIYLYDNNLTGPLPPFNSSALKQIQLHSNFLSGTIPSSFASLSSLHTLLLDFNNLTGSLPDGLASLPAISTFAVADNLLSGSLSSEWGLHSKLFQFDVTNNNFTGTFPPHLCNGNGLAYLSLKQNHIKDSIPENYGKCQSVLRFIVAGNELFGKVPSGLWTLPSIKIIDLQDNYLSGKISLSSNSDNEYGSLQTIFLDSNQLEGSISSEISKFWFNLKKLSAAQNKLSGPLPSEIGHLTQLESLNLSMNAISSEIPSSIAGCASLTSLSLFQNHLTGAIPPELSHIQDLNYIDLSRNQLNGTIPTVIAKSTYVHFDVSYNDLSGTVPELLVDSFSVRSFEGNPKLCISPESCHLASAKGSEDGNLKTKLLVPIVVLAVCAVVLCLALTVRMYRKRKGAAQVEQGASDWMVVPFQRLGFDEGEIYQKLEEKDMIGWGGSGRVYKVSLKEGRQVVAVKKLMPKLGVGDGGLCESRRGESFAFKAEMETMGKIQHKNIVKLMCACECKQAQLLVYEYMCNGSLGDVLHKSYSSEMCCWATRFKIALGAAEGLAYLHHDCMPPILHRDIKSNNILLDSCFEAKLGDFGVAKALHYAKASMTGVVGSVGYIAPEYAYTLKVDEKSDVYSYGVVLLELLTGRSPGCKELECDRIDLVKWVAQMVAQSKEDFWKVLDCRLEVTDIDKESMANVLKLALLCTCVFPRQRPSMREVVEFLHRTVPMSILLSQQHHAPPWDKEKHITVSVVT